MKKLERKSFGIKFEQTKMAEMSTGCNGATFGNPGSICHYNIMIHKFPFAFSDASYTYLYINYFRATFPS